MTKRILASILTISGLSVIIAVLLATALLHNYSTEKLETEIATDAEIIAEAVEINGGRFLNETSFSSDIRVTMAGLFLIRKKILRNSTTIQTERKSTTR